MSWRSSGKVALIGLLAAILGSGCGTLSQLTGGSHREARLGARSGDGTQSRVSGGKKAKKPKRGKTVLREVGSFTGVFDRRTGRLTIQAPTARTRATRYGPASALTMTGTAPAPVGGVMSGNVTLASTNPVELLDVRAVLESISETSVTANNFDGKTELTGMERPYWKFDDLTVTQRSSTKLWKFNNPGGVSFTFRIAVYANTFTFTSADGNAFRAASFVNASTGWAVGSGGKLFKTVDGGATWAPQNTGTGEDLKDVSFVSANHGWAVGSTGTVIATSDGGFTWRHQRIQYTDPDFGPTTFFGTLYGVKFLSTTKGFAVGEDRAIFCTIDSGNTWSLKTSTDTSTLYDICFASATTGWAVGDQTTVLKTIDGGNTWTTQTIPTSERLSSDPILNVLQAVTSPDGSRVCAVGLGGWVIVSSNGGANWTRRNRTPAPATTNLLTGVFFPTPSVGWAVTQSGTGAVNLIKTTDGGTTWSPVSPPPIGGSMYGVTGIIGNTNLLWIACDNGLMLYTTNGGTSWLRPGDAGGARWATSGSNLNALWFVDKLRGWAAGENGVLLRTTDGGASWRTPSGFLGTSHFNDVHFIDANEGWAVGSTGKIVHTTNGGQNWSAQVGHGFDIPDITPPHINGVRFLDALNGWIVGGGATIQKTTDGGATWEFVSPPLGVTAGLKKIHWLDANRGWIIGNSGVILVTDDGGLNWSQGFSGSTRALNGIDVVAAGPAGVSGWIVGDQRTLLHSTDGFDWEAVDLSSFGSLVNLNSVDFTPDGQTGWVVGDSGFLLRTRNGGASWELVNPGDATGLQAVRIVDVDETWIGGRSGTLKVFR
jgi:photosystem II stability/assembly factor-like uncharacterized protein